MAKKAKASRRRAMSMTRLLNKAARSRSFFRRLMKDPAATLERDELSVTASNLRKLDRMSKLLKKRIPIKLKPPTTVKALRQLHIPRNSDWGVPDWRHEWVHKQFPSSGTGHIKLPK